MPVRRRRRFLALLLPFLLTAAVAGACGGGDGGGDDSSPDRAALEVYFRDVESITTDLEMAVAEDVGDLADLRTLLTETLDRLNGLTVPLQVAAAHASLVEAWQALALAAEQLPAGPEELESLPLLIAAYERHGAEPDVAGLRAALTSLTAIAVDHRISVALPSTVVAPPAGDPNEVEPEHEPLPDVGSAGPASLTATAESGAVVAGTGTYCWTSPLAADGDGQAVGLCVDMIGIMTGPLSLAVRAGETVALLGDLPWADFHDGAVQAWPRPAQPVATTATALAWQPAEEGTALTALPGPARLNFVADLPPGRYLVGAFLTFEQGDVMYGVLLDVAAGAVPPPPTGDLTVDLGAAFTLAIGGSAVVAETALLIRFDDVLQDSRCPRDVTCIRAGDATLLFTTLLAGEPAAHRVVVDAAGSGRFDAAGFTVTALGLAPEPLSTAPIAAGDYRVRLRVTATAAPAPAVCAARFPGGLAVGDLAAEPFICIERPEPNATLTGAVEIVGYAAGAFENAIVVELHDTGGALLDGRPVQVAAPDVGLVVGRWAVTLTPLAVASDAPGFVVAYAVSPRDGAVSFSARIPVRLLPPTPPPDDGPPDPSPYPEVEARAPIDAVTISVAESFPPQYFVHIRSGLPNGCARFERFEVHRDGTEIVIDVWNHVPAPDAGILCTLIYGTVESNVPLGSDFLPGVQYTVRVNDVVQSFVAQ